MYAPPTTLTSTSSFSYTLSILNAFLQPTTTLGTGELTWAIDPTDCVYLDQWRVSRLTVITPSSLLQNRHVVARLFRGTESSEAVDLRLEPPQHSSSRLFDAVAIALDALSISTEPSSYIGGSSPLPIPPPPTPSEFPLAITFAPVPNSPVNANLNVEEEVLYQLSTTADSEEGSLTLLTLAHCITSIPSAGFRGDFVQDFVDAFKGQHCRVNSINYSDISTSDNESEVDTPDCDEDGFLDYYLQPPRPLDLSTTIHHPEPLGWIDISECEDLTSINEEFQRLSEVRLQLAADLRSSLLEAEKTAREVQEFNARQRERERRGEGPQVLIEYEDDEEKKQAVVEMIQRLEESSYVRGLRRE